MSRGRNFNSDNGSLYGLGGHRTWVAMVDGCGWRCWRIFLLRNIFVPGNIHTNYCRGWKVESFDQIVAASIDVVILLRAIRNVQYRYVWPGSTAPGTLTAVPALIAGTRGKASAGKVCGKTGKVFISLPFFFLLLHCYEDLIVTVLIEQVTLRVIKRKASPPTLVNTMSFGNSYNGGKTRMVRKPDQCTSSISATQKSSPRSTSTRTHVLNSQSPPPPPRLIIHT